MTKAWTNVLQGTEQEVMSHIYNCVQSSSKYALNSSVLALFSHQNARNVKDILADAGSAFQARAIATGNV